MKKHWFKIAGIFLLILLMILTFAACKRGPQDQGEKRDQPDTNPNIAKEQSKVISYQLKNEPSGLDPAFTANAMTTMVTSNIFEGLLAFEDTNVMLKPSLAERWEVSEDEKEYTFFLRRGVTFHDNTPFNAEAVVMSFDRIRKGSVEGESWSKTFIEVIETLEAVDNYTVRFLLKHPYTPFLSSLAMKTVTPIVSSRAITEMGNVSLNPIGTGPFRFVEWNNGKNIRLERNDEYWGDKPYLGGIDFQLDVLSTAQAGTMLRNGEIDIIDLDRDREGGEDIYYYRANNIMPSFIALNTSKFPFNDVRNRRAVAHALNRRELFDRYFSGSGNLNESFIPQGVFGHDSQMLFYPFDIGMAQNIRGEENEENQIIQIVDTTINNFSFNQDLIIALKRIGFQAEFVGDRGESDIYYILRNNLYDMFIFTWQWGNPDPDVLGDLVDQENLDQNVSKYINNELASLLERGVLLPNGEERRKVYQRVQEILKEDVVLIPLFNIPRTYAFKAHVKNFRVHPTGHILFQYIQM
jgi:peptide/nickel transport system substrate-binding protein